jgi:hypothetical protein
MGADFGISMVTLFADSRKKLIKFSWFLRQASIFEASVKRSHAGGPRAAPSPCLPLRR